MSATAEPALRSYFFWKGYQDLRATIVESWKLNLASARDHFKSAEQYVPREGVEKGLAAFFGAAGASVVLFGTAVFVIASIIHIVVLFTFFLLIYVAFSLIHLAERAYLLGKRFFTVCPACHSKTPLPVYFCPRCSAAHRRLIPSSYGILKRTCTCGETLPATFFLNRDDLRASCPDCGHLLQQGHFLSKKAFVPVLGGPSVGKSAFLFSAVHQFLTQVAPRRGLSTGFVDTRTEKEYARVCEALNQGRPPDKTLATLPHALNVELGFPQGEKSVLYLYDPAGEALAETEGLSLHKYQGYLSGIIFLIDPFAIPAVRKEYSTKLGAVENALKPSSLPVEDALSRLIIGLETHFGLGKAAKVTVPVAVVVNKADAFDLASRLRLGISPATVANRVREQLIRWDIGDVVQQLETRCSNVRYFSCSALGRMPDSDSRAFKPKGVLEPLMWVLDGAVPALRADGAVTRSRPPLSPHAAGVVFALAAAAGALSLLVAAAFSVQHLVKGRSPAAAAVAPTAATPSVATAGRAGSGSAAPPLPAHPNRGQTKIDFSNFTYPSVLCAKHYGQYGMGTSVQVRNGEFRAGQGSNAVYFGLVKHAPGGGVFYDELEDGGPVAIVHAGCGLATANFGESELFAFRMKGGQAALFAHIDQDQLAKDYARYHPDGVVWRIADNGIRVNAGLLSINLYTDGPHCCPVFLTTMQYTLRQNSLVPNGPPIRRPFTAPQQTSGPIR